MGLSEKDLKAPRKRGILTQRGPILSHGKALLLTATVYHLGNNCSLQIELAATVPGDPNWNDCIILMAWTFSVLKT